MTLEYLESELKLAHHNYKDISQTYRAKDKEYKDARDKYLRAAEEYQKAYAKFIKDSFKGEK